jgi:hypothetical protein
VNNETVDKTRATILAELLSDDAEVRAEYLKYFRPQVETFATVMAEAMMAWRDLEAVRPRSEDKGLVVAQTFVTLTLLTISMKLLISGQLTAAGNLFRQALESIALALLLSNKGLSFVARYKEDQYSSSNAIRDVIKHSKALGLLPGSTEPLKEAQKRFHIHSHPTRMTLAAVTPLTDGGLYVGASFDFGKIDGYRDEIANRMGLVDVLRGFVFAVKSNLEKW